MSARPGFALIVSVVLAIALGLLSLGMLTVAMRESQIAAGVVSARQAALTAESAVRQALVGWSTRESASLAAGEVRVLRSDDSVTLQLERLDSALFLLRSAARGRGRASATAGAIVRVLVPEAITEAFRAAAAVEDGATLTGGSVSGSGQCPAGDGGGPGVRGAPVSVAAEADVTGDPAFDPTPPPPPPPPDPFAPPLVERLADRRVSPGDVTPIPRAGDGVCLPLDDNWGAQAPSHPCHEAPPLVLGTGPISVQSGEGRGILVVVGDLAVGGTFRYDGLVVVTGTLTVTGGARLRGAVRAGELRMDGGSLQLDRCLVQTMASAPALDRAFRLPGRLWVPVY